MRGIYSTSMRRCIAVKRDRTVIHRLDDMPTSVERFIGSLVTNLSVQTIHRLGTNKCPVVLRQDWLSIKKTALRLMQALDRSAGLSIY